MIKHILSQKFVASHKLALSSTAHRIDNVLMIFSIASYDKISSDKQVNEEKDGQYMHNRQNALTDMP